jgi:hypothetical protein
MKLEMEEWLARPEVRDVVGVPVSMDVSPSEDPYDNNVSCFISFERATPENDWVQKYIMFHIKSLPGCCGVMVIHSLNSTDVSQKTVNTIMNGVLEIIRNKARTGEWGKMVLCTTIRPQKNFIKWLQHAKFTPGPKSRNPRTGQTITTWTKDLTLPKPKRTPSQEFVS